MTKRLNFIVDRSNGICDISIHSSKVISSSSEDKSVTKTNDLLENTGEAHMFDAFIGISTVYYTKSIMWSLVMFNICLTAHTSIIRFPME